MVIVKLSNITSQKSIFFLDIHNHVLWIFSDMLQIGMFAIFGNVIICIQKPKIISPNIMTSTTTTYYENDKACVKCGNKKHEQCRLPILTLQTENEKSISKGDQKRTHKKITYKANERCPLMDMILPKTWATHICWPLLEDCKPLISPSIAGTCGNSHHIHPMSWTSCTHTQVIQNPRRSSSWYEPSYVSPKIGPNEIHKSSPCLTLVHWDSHCQTPFWHQSSLFVYCQSWIHKMICHWSHVFSYALLCQTTTNNSHQDLLIVCRRWRSSLSIWNSNCRCYWNQ